jgi:hypothetical protein
MNAIEYAEFKKSREENLQLIKELENPTWSFSDLPFIVVPFIDSAWGEKWSFIMILSGRLWTVRAVVDVFFAAYNADTQADYYTPLQDIESDKLTTLLSLADDNGNQFFGLNSDETTITWSRDVFTNKIIEHRNPNESGSLDPRWVAYTKKGDE